MKQQIESWGPVIRAIIEQTSSEQATSAILALLPVILDVSPRQTAEAPPPKPTPTPSLSRRPAPSPTPTPSPSPPAETPAAGLKSKTLAGGQLDPFAFFTPDEAAAFLGLGRERVYQILRSDPEVLPHRRVGREYQIRGRELEALRKRRETKAAEEEEEKKKEAENEGEDEGDGEDGKDDGSRPIY